MSWRFLLSLFCIGFSLSGQEFTPREADLIPTDARIYTFTFAQEPEHLRMNCI